MTADDERIGLGSSGAGRVRADSGCFGAAGVGGFGTSTFKTGAGVGLVFGSGCGAVFAAGGGLVFSLPAAEG